MNAITHQTLKSPLHAFWRAGRQKFVPLTQDELDRAGVDSWARRSLAGRGLAKADNRSIWELTPEGMRAFKRVLERDNRPDPYEAASNVLFAEVLSKLLEEPLSNSGLAAQIGRSGGTTSLRVKQLCELKLVRRTHHIGKTGQWAVIAITDAGRAWLAEHGAAQ